MTIIVTGGAGFIGSHFVDHWLSTTNERVVNIDKLTYASSHNHLARVRKNAAYVFIEGDICDAALLRSVFGQYRPSAVIHLAAESHVDRSIKIPHAFINTNIVGTYQLLEAARIFWSTLSEDGKAAFRFLHVSTDEVYGSLSPGAAAFIEASRYEPNSPYSASKAASDHLVRAYHQTYGLPVLTTHCSNNHGPYQYPEKLIPRVIYNALTHQSIPVYGDGLQIRDWLYVTDHCTALSAVHHRGIPGQVYNIGGLNEKTNIEVVRLICNILDQIYPLCNNTVLKSYHDLITFVKDRPGHDRRYAIDTSKIQRELQWRPQETFETGITKTVAWYLDNKIWLEQVLGANQSCAHERELV